MDRRNFLLGTFGGVVGAGLLVKASDADINEFALTKKEGDQIGLANPPTSVLSELGQIVFNHLGLPIGVITEIKRECLDVTGLDDQWRKYAASRTIEYRVLNYGIGTISLDAKSRSLKIR